MSRKLAWSYSRLSTFERCPKQFEYRAKRTPEAPSPAMDRGSRIHKDAEEYLKGKHKQVPATLQSFEKEFRALKKAGATAETQIAVTEDWQRVEWFSPLAWLRIVLDAQHPLTKTKDVVIDFKTGRAYDDHLSQLELYALVFFRLRPHLREVEGELWYLDQLEITSDTFEAEKADDLEGKWRARATPLLTAKAFPATPGRHCSFCGFASRKGGPCPEDRKA